MSARRTIAVPSEFLPLLLECLLSALRSAAQAIESCGLDPEAYREPLSEFDAIRATLDAIGWGATTERDVDAHREALQAALTARLETERAMLADARVSIEREHRGGEDQVQAAYAYTLRVERFMRDAGLEIPQAGKQDV